MIPVADPFMAGVGSRGIQRGRGGFYRNSADVPFVSDPTGATVKSGERKGEIKRLMYGQPSNRGKQIENTTNLVKWGERRCVFGIGRDPALVEACQALVGLELDSDEYKTAADAIIIAAKDAAKAHLAADRGTHVHLLTEDFDDGRDWVLRAEVGELVDLDRETQNALVGGWHRMLAEQQLQVLAVEASCVDDAWRLAGTLDRIVRTGKTLRFARPGGEVAEIPAGTVVVLDVKTSNKRLDRNGCVQYWNAFSIQIASYAQSVPYDTEAEVRGEWPWPINQQHALIAHPDIDTADWELIYVDLAAGREHGGETVVQAKAWEQRSDIYSVAQLDSPAAMPVAAVTAGEGPVVDPDPSPAPSVPDWETNSNVQLREKALMVPIYEPSACLTPDPARMALVDARATLSAEPDEGADLAVGFDELWDNLKALFDTLDPAARSWRSELVNAAQRHLVPFHVQSVRTERTWNLNRGLIALCLAGCDRDEVLRALLAVVIGDVALFPSLELGHLVGSLGAVEAAKLAELCDAWVADALVAYTDEAGTLRYRDPAA